MKLKNKANIFSYVKENRRYYLIGIPIFLTLAAISLLDFLQSTRLDAERFAEEYQSLRVEDQISGTILSVRCVKGNAIILLSGERKLQIARSVNYKYEVFELCCFLQSNDSIIKYGNSTELNVIKEDSTYTFLIGQKIDGSYWRRFYNNPCR